MFFVLSKMAFMVLSPLNLAILLLSGAMLGMYYKRFALARRLGFASWAVLMIFGVLPTGSFILSKLESQYPYPQTLPNRVDGVILLGGFIDTDIGTTRGDVQVQGAADRLFTFTDMAKKYPYAPLVFTSGIGNITQSGPAEGALIKPLLERMRAYTRTRLTIEDKSRTTYENATLTKQLVNPNPRQTWLLVTSAWHMPRAMGAFRAAGWENVIAIPSDYLTTGQPQFKFNFSANMVMSQVAIKELGGMAVYALTGKWKKQ